MAYKHFTDEQSLAITTRDCDLLVAAAAGSGKTAVLVERIIALIEKPVYDIDRLLVVTFTEAAASEMRARISSALLEKLDDDPTNENLKKQSALINKSSISTIHKFCRNVINNYFYLTDIDPSFKVADKIEMELIKNECLEQLFEEEFAQENNEKFIALVESYGGTKTSDAAVFKLVTSLHSFISNIPFADEWIVEKLEYFNKAEENALEPWFGVVRDYAKTTLSGVLESVADAIYIASSEHGPNQYLEALVDDKDMILRLIDACDKDFESMYNEFSQIVYTTLSRKKGQGEVSPDKKEMVMQIRNKDIKKNIEKIKKGIMFKSPSAFLADVKSVYPILQTLCEVTSKFSAAYQLAKKERNLVDFNDLEHFCLEILLSKDSTSINIKPSKAAIEISEKFGEIMIDEYQDSNAVQELILSLVSRKNPNNRFMVGDIKQSVYKFRRANPAIFLGKYNTFSSDGENGGMRIDLFKNFRSREVVLSAINFLFYQIMSEKAGEIVYDEKVALFPGATFEDASGLQIADNVELIVAEYNTKDVEYDEENAENVEKLQDKDEIENVSKVEFEAQIIANRIKEMVEGAKPLFVYDKDIKGYRKAEFGDIVIVSRSVRAIAPVYLKVFKAAGIALFAESSGGYYYALETSTVLSLLQIIDNPRQDIPLLTVLRSAIYNFDDDLLLSIRQFKQKCTFYEALVCYSLEHSNAKVDAFQSDLAKWRKLAVYMPISELIDLLLEQTGFINLVGAMLGGNVRIANLKALCEKAAVYEETSLKGLFNFNKYIEKLLKAEEDEGESKVLAESENVVKMMTIHKSKGLEFPVVFVCMMHKKFSTLDTKQSNILHQDLGFGPLFVDILNRTKSKTIASVALAKKVQLENLSEEMRVLYVALTRAKEKLVLVGTVSDCAKSIDKWGKYAGLAQKELPVHYVANCDNYLDWVGAAVARHKDGKIFALNVDNAEFTANEQLFNYKTKFNVSIVKQQTLSAQIQVSEEEKQTLYENLGQHTNELVNDELYVQICEKMAWVYPYFAQTTMPAKISISEIKRIYQKEQMDEFAQVNLYEKPTIVTPQFLKDETKPSKARVGTLIHTVMEHLNVAVHKNEKDIFGLIDILISKNILEFEESKAIPVDKIANFLKSDIANRMRNAAEIHKETPFVIGLAPSEIYKGEHLDESGGIILVHGIIDCYFVEINDKKEKNIVLIDYKSDYVTDVEIVKETYKIQLELYKTALERSLGQKVSQKLLYLFHLNNFVEIS